MLTFYPLTPERLRDFESLFGERGACGGCWCMWFRLTRSQFEQQKGELNKQAMRALVDSGDIPGILAYEQSRAVGWCSVAPRSEFPLLQRSRILKPIDEQPVWSIVCLFVEKSHRKKGISVELLKAATKHARENGGHILEGYAVEPRKDVMPDVFAYTGLKSAFEQAGFKEVMRRSETRPIMRLIIKS